MAFVTNKHNQISLNDSVLTLTEREEKFLKKSWANAFAENVFSAIDEETFSVLYSNKASRPNTPVNIIIGAMILKELHGLTDDEIVEALMFDIRFQYALHTTSFKEQPLSDRTLSRFRERCRTYETTTGIDLMKTCITKLSQQIAHVMGITPSMMRMDSMMVASNIKKLSRLELLYTCVANLVKCMAKQQDDIPENMKHYCDKDDFNKIVYHLRSVDIDSRLKPILEDATVLITHCEGEYDHTSEYQSLVRVISEQTHKSDEGNLILKDKKDKSLNASVLLSPVDPDATFRHKAGKEHRGYVANLTEAVGEDNKGSLILDYAYEQNIYSDYNFLNTALKEMPVYENEATLVTDGAYAGVDNTKLAKEHNIKLVTTNFTGIKPAEIFAKFQFSEDGKRLIKCAGGQTPKTCKYDVSNDRCRVTLDKEICNNCLYKKECNPREHKKHTSLEVSWKSVNRAKQLTFMKSEEFKELAHFRNGVESLPSILRRKYNVDKMPVRGKIKTKFLFGIKVAALNFVKLFNYLNSLDLYTSKLELA